jgi:phosphoribosylpyrophosphate synthetase
MPTEGFAHVSINDHIMELLILISACKMGSAKRITGNLL